MSDVNRWVLTVDFIVHRMAMDVSFETTIGSHSSTSKTAYSLPDLAVE